MACTLYPFPPVPDSKPIEREGEGGRENSAKGCINLKASFVLVLYQPHNLGYTPILYLIKGQGLGKSWKPSSEETNVHKNFYTMKMKE